MQMHCPTCLNSVEMHCLLSFSILSDFQLFSFHALFLYMVKVGCNSMDILKTDADQLILDCTSLVNHSDVDPKIIVLKQSQDFYYFIENVSYSCLLIYFETADCKEDAIK